MSSTEPKVVVRIFTFVFPIVMPQTTNQHPNMANQGSDATLNDAAGDKIRDWLQLTKNGHGPLKEGVRILPFPVIPHP